VLVAQPSSVSETIVGQICFAGKPKGQQSYDADCPGIAQRANVNGNVALHRSYRNSKPGFNSQRYNLV
jgi:hypothetical protein